MAREPKSDTSSTTTSTAGAAAAEAQPTTTEPAAPAAEATPPAEKKVELIYNGEVGPVAGFSIGGGVTLYFEAGKSQSVSDAVAKKLLRSSRKDISGKVTE
jgi:hypothetical protein